MSFSNRRFPFAHAFNQLLRILLPAVVVAAFADSAKAQNPMPIGEGARVRITVPGAKKVVGLVKARTADSTTVYLEGYGGTQRFLNSDITSLQVSHGRTMKEGARKGLLWGGGIGGVFALLVYAVPDDNASYSKSVMVTQTVLGSLFWGGGIGALVKAEQWENVPVHPRLAVSHTSGGVGVSLAFSPSFLH